MSIAFFNFNNINTILLKKDKIDTVYFTVSIFCYTLILDHFFLIIDFGISNSTVFISIYKIND